MNQELYPELPILFVDDNEDFLDGATANLRLDGINNTEICTDILEVLSRLKRKNYSIIFLDLIMPGMRGEELLPQIVKQYPEIPVIVLTAIEDVETAKSCIYSGAHDYLVKPIKAYKLKKSIENVLKYVNAHNVNNRLRESLFSDALKNPEYFKKIITRNEEMISIFNYIEAIAQSNEPVLIIGETGVGKELIAQAIHKCSQRPGDIISVNIAGFDDHLFSDTVFGHVKGAFTDAVKDRKGQVKLARNGTLFLDEIGDLELKSQVKLLRLLQEREYLPLGAEEHSTSNARVIVATNKDVEDLIEKGKFRKDLYQRLKCHPINVPPLKERKEDIALLVRHFVIDSARKMKREIPQFDEEELYELLVSYDFTGNVRELKTTIHDVVSTSKEGTSFLEMFSKKIGKPVLKKKKKSGETEPPYPEFQNVRQDITSRNPFPKFEEIEKDYIDKIEKIYLEELMIKAHYSTEEAKEIYGLSRQTLERRLKKHKIKWGRNRT